MNRNRTAHRRRRTSRPETDRPETDVSRIDAEAITSMVTAGKSNPFPAGSPEHIAFAWTGELQRHAASDGDTPITRRARRIFPEVAQKKRRATRPATDVAATEPPAGTPPIPARKPEQSVQDAGPTAIPPLPSTKPVPPKVPPTEIWNQADLFPVSRTFADEIDRAENSNNERDKVSPTDALGRYQLRWRALFDVGLMQDEDTWRLGGLPGRSEFLKDPLLQNLAFAAYLQTMKRFLVANGSTSYIGQTIEGKIETFEVSESGLLAAAHRYGQGNVLAYLKHQSKNKWVTDENTFGSKENIFLAIETRLQNFSDVPVRSSPSAPPLVNQEMFE